jgi:hypothetical protein
MGLSHSPLAVTNGLLLSLDFYNPKNYVSGTTASSSVIPTTFTFKNGATYNTVTNGILTVTRAATVTTKANDGGGIYTAALTGSLASTTFLYNDHTWEVWVRINDNQPSNYDANETASCITGYRGYNAGFSFFNAFNLYYSMWDGIATNVVCATFSIGTTTENLIIGNWHQIVVTRSGNVFTPYVNGVPKGTGSTNSPSVTGIGTSNELSVGSFNQANFINYGKISFSNMKMYNRALSENEVLQNFNALRGRVGL